MNKRDIQLEIERNQKLIDILERKLAYSEGYSIMYEYYSRISSLCFSVTTISPMHITIFTL